LVSVAFIDLESSAEAFVRADERVHAASTFKLAVLMAIHRLAATGELRMDESIAVENRFVSLVDGAQFAVGEEDLDHWTHAQLGRSASLEALLERMIVPSGNLATNLILRRVTPERVTAMCRELGADVHVLRGVDDRAAHAKGLDNTATARGLVTLLCAIGEARVPGAQEMIDLLERAEPRDGIPAGVPAGTPVAHKTGRITGHVHDAALVFPPDRRPYALAVLTRGFARDADAFGAIRAMSGLVWDCVTRSP
jgi:beta-lactamase class A